MLELNNIKKDYPVGDDKVHALKGISLGFRENEFVSVLGPSGCGKTTLLNIIGGLDHYTSGDLVISGVSTKNFTDRDWDTYRNHRIGFVFQSYNLIPHQTVSENVELALNISGVGRAERVRRAHEALDKVGLKDQYNKKPNQLSGGQMQRVAIARALVNDPEILLADEPTGALDTVTSTQIMDLIREVSQSCLVIMVTHNPELAEKYSTRIIKLLDGEVISDSDPFVPGSAESAENAESAESETSPETAPSAENAATTAAVVPSSGGKAHGDNDAVGGEQEKKQKSGKKSKLSLWSAFMLSAKNLLSKMKRTVLVCFAGSIGIIGVATVLAVSSGVTGFIKDMQDDMLSGNPVTISEDALDLSSLMDMSGFGQQSDALTQSVEDGKINVDKMIETLIKSSGQMDSFKVKNNITNDYVDFVKQMPEEYYNSIATYYGLDLSNNLYTDFTYTVRGEGEELKQEVQTTSLAAATRIYLSMLKKTEQANFAQYINLVSSSFTQLPGDVEFLKSQYDIISDPETSKMATEENEIMIVVSDKTALTDLMLAQFGYYTQDEFFNICYKATESDRFDEALWKDRFTYEELMGKTFTWYPNDTVFTKTPDGSPLASTVPFTYSHNVGEDWDNGIELKVTAILRPKEDLSYGSLTDGFFYTPALTRKILDINLKSEIVKYLADNEFESFSSIGAQAGIPMCPTYKYSYYFEGENYTEQGFVGESESLSAIMGSMMGQTLPDYFTLSNRMLGGVDVPSRISVYPVNFDFKDDVTEYLTGWNGDGEITVGDKILTADERSEITYTDNLQIVISLVNNMVQIVTIALVAFTALSLVVSTVMIAIITYVSVIERIKEIGVIRSLGGRKRDVSALFNAETFIIGAISGIIGIAVTYLIQVILNTSLNIAFGVTNIAALPFTTALIMIALSIILTLISGLIPAWIAARKDPVEALRTE